MLFFWVYNSCWFIDSHRLLISCDSHFHQWSIQSFTCFGNPKVLEKTESWRNSFPKGQGNQKLVKSGEKLDQPRSLKSWHKHIACYIKSMLHHRASTHCIFPTSFNERIGAKNLTNQNCCKASSQHGWYTFTAKKSCWYTHSLKAVKTSKMTRHFLALLVAAFFSPWKTSCFICAKPSISWCKCQRLPGSAMQKGSKQDRSEGKYLPSSPPESIAKNMSIIPNSSRLFRDQCQFHRVYRCISMLTIALNLQIYTQELMQATQARIFSASLVGTKSPEDFVRCATKQQEMLSEPALFGIILTMSGIISGDSPQTLHKMHICLWHLWTVRIVLYHLKNRILFAQPITTCKC